MLNDSWKKKETRRKNRSRRGMRMKRASKRQTKIEGKSKQEWIKKTVNTDTNMRTQTNTEYVGDIRWLSIFFFGKKVQSHLLMKMNSKSFECLAPSSCKVFVDTLGCRVLLGNIENNHFKLKSKINIFWIWFCGSRTAF